MQSKGSLLLLLRTLHSNRDINNNTRKKKKTHNHHFKSLVFPPTPPSTPILLLKDQPGIIRTVPLARPSLPNIFCEHHTVHWEQQGFWILDPNCDSAGCGSSDLQTNRRGPGNHFDVISATSAFWTLCMTYQRLSGALYHTWNTDFFFKSMVRSFKKGQCVWGRPTVTAYVS